MGLMLFKLINDTKQMNKYFLIYIIKYSESNQQLKRLLSDSCIQLQNIKIFQQHSYYGNQNGSQPDAPLTDCSDSIGGWVWDCGKNRTTVITQV